MLKNIDDLSGSSNGSDGEEDPNQLYYNEEVDPVDAGSGGSSRDYMIEEVDEESKLAGSNEDFNCSSNSVQSSSTGTGEQVMVSHPPDPNNVQV